MHMYLIGLKLQNNCKIKFRYTTRERWPAQLSNVLASETLKDVLNCGYAAEKEHDKNAARTKNFLRAMQAVVVIYRL